MGGAMIARGGGTGRGTGGKLRKRHLAEPEFGDPGFVPGAVEEGAGIPDRSAGAADHSLAVSAEADPLAAAVAEGRVHGGEG